MERIPRATYRLQFNPEQLSFEDGAEQVDYLARLGVSHVYASPCLQAASGSTHGYDVVDPGRVSSALGGTSGYDRFCRSLSKAGLGQVLDIVPNHMAISRDENRWWWDVLELGRSSRYAPFFDIDWSPPEPRLAGRILLPVLGDHYGRVLESGELRLAPSTDGPVLQYHEHCFPLSPSSRAVLLRRAARASGSNALLRLALGLASLPLSPSLDRRRAEHRDRDKERLLAEFREVLEAEPEAQEALESLIHRLNADPDRLDRLIQTQHYRPAFWRVVARDLGYRRFFAINSLVGLRMEETEVFEQTHGLVLRWIKEGRLDGLRIDHPDGLRDPAGYLDRLRRAAPKVWVVAEKILHPGEQLPQGWPVAGTTGYDFLHAVSQALVDQSGEPTLTELYARFSGETRSYPEVAREKKREAMAGMLGGDISRLTERLVLVCERHRRHRDYTRPELRRAVCELIACLPVYRTYVRSGDGTPAGQDLRLIEAAARDAASSCPELDPGLFDFLRQVLSLEIQGQAEQDFLLTLQQVSGPVAAKGLEDRAFYCYNRLAALNEVGGDPACFGSGPEVLHSFLAEAARKRPWSMLATSTHDTKRSEDVRARLFLLSEIPERWGEAVWRWAARNAPAKTGGLPEANLEYLLYQTMVGVWPIGKDRLEAFMLKAAREAGVHTAWTDQDSEYEQALSAFVHRLCNDQGFLDEMEAFVRPLVRPGRINSLTQTLIKLSAPGVPDIYQGTELWDLSLVDPDNRRPVDFALRRRLLEAAESLNLEGILAREDEGLPKLWLLRQTLRLRAERPGLFARAGYEPLWAEGEKERHVLAFRRGQELVGLAPRLPLGLSRGWGETWLRLPEGYWENRLDSRRLPGGWQKLERLLERFPVALLVRIAR